MNQALAGSLTMWRLGTCQASERWPGEGTVDLAEFVNQVDTVGARHTVGITRVTE